MNGYQWLEQDVQNQVRLADREGNLTKGHGGLAGGHRVPSPCMHLTSKRSGGDWRGMSHISIKCSRGAGRWRDRGLLQGEGPAWLLRLSSGGA